MIKTFGDRAIERFYETGRGFRRLDVNLALRRLDMLNAATALDSISPLKSVNLHRLRGSYSGYWAINVGQSWRIISRFRGGDAYDVEIIDYHRG